MDISALQPLALNPLSPINNELKVLFIVQGSLEE